MTDSRPPRPSAATEAHPLRATRYVRSVHELKNLPPDVGREVAIAGRSNAGKSSAINAITDQNRLARTSKTPGRTQQLNYFEVAPEKFLVDLPGYGYAKVPPALRAHWEGLIDTFFRTREALKGLVVVMDIRHPLRDFDLQMLGYGRAGGLHCHCLLTKADKLPRGQQAKALLETRRALGDDATVQLFSAEDRTGVEEARAVLERWLALAPPA
ncbi:ribosome biogenesis GTP-binding protein YihA/YsxC [Chiayiivirga flava]|uniref:Probable GTP-binding protein EngB n=1 Tax=Chiayiivirga flava TaxID=659595 RepID=A0A7W8D8T8_9GAMM|nr:ribosome biogenesis GTP-binding protein YihA/YsxC [Chiayiivirga flava]MBB5208905.1 GTP-binding protein [Chiayiivirga flava]